MAEDRRKFEMMMIFVTLMFSEFTISVTKQLSSSKPHVVIIVADDLGWNDVSWHNSDVITPHLEHLANNGVILNQSYVQPMCTPTRAALLTGRYPFTIGLQNYVIRPMEPRGMPLGVKTLPQLLRKAGYSTHAIGKWHLGFCSWDYTPTKRGFDSFYGFYTGAQDYFSHKKPAAPKAKTKKYAKLNKRRRTRYLDLRNDTIPDNTKEGIYSTHVFTSAADDLLRSRDPKDPMFLYLAFQSVHTPLQVPKTYAKAFKNVKDTRRRIYLGMVRAMDEAVGQLLTSLRETGHYNNSVIIFTTDNGGSVRFGASNWPLRGGKRTLWEGGTRGPAFVHSPLLTHPGTVNNQLVHVTDWFSTVLGIAGAHIPKEVDGFNLWGTFSGTSPSPRHWIIYNIDDTETFKATIRFNDYKMIVGAIGSFSWVMTSTSNDPFPANKTTTFHPVSWSVDKKSSKSNNLTSGVFSPSMNDKSVTSPSTRSNIKTFDINIQKYSSVTGYFNNQGSSVIQNNSETIIPKSPKLKASAEVKRNKVKGPRRIYWHDLKDNPRFKKDPEILRKLDKYMKKRTRIRLFNIVDDPEERTDLAFVYVKKLKIILDYLSRQLHRYVPTNGKKEQKMGHPENWGNVWAPGWCQAT